MATIKPFRALRPIPDKAERVACAPYDVVYESEAREQIEENRETFLRVTRPEADLPPGVDPHSPQAFEKGRENLEAFIRDGIYELDPDGLETLRLYFEQFWGRALLAYKAALEKPTKEVS